jgi:flagellar biosynthesis protein FliQ
MLIFFLVGVFKFPGAMFVAVVIAVVIACVQAKWSWLSFIPGTFAGMACTFGTSGDWKATVIALIIGGCMGWLAEQGGLLILKIFTKTNKKEDKQTA